MHPPTGRYPRRYKACRDYGPSPRTSPRGLLSSSSFWWLSPLLPLPRSCILLEDPHASLFSGRQWRLNGKLNPFFQVSDDLRGKVFVCRFHRVLAFGHVLDRIGLSKNASLQQDLSADCDGIAGSTCRHFVGRAILDRSVVVVVAMSVGTERLAFDDAWTLPGSRVFHG